MAGAAGARGKGCPPQRPPPPPPWRGDGGGGAGGVGGGGAVRRGVERQAGRERFCKHKQVYVSKNMFRNRTASPSKGTKLIV